MYQQIVDVLIEKAQSQDVVYAVPGHPRVAETTTAKLLDYNDHHQDVNVKMLGGKVLLMISSRRLTKILTMVSLC